MKLFSGVKSGIFKVSGGLFAPRLPVAARPIAGKVNSGLRGETTPQLSRVASAGVKPSRRY